MTTTYYCYYYYHYCYLNKLYVCKKKKVVTMPNINNQMGGFSFEKKSEFCHNTLIEIKSDAYSNSNFVDNRTSITLL